MSHFVLDFVSPSHHRFGAIWVNISTWSDFDRLPWLSTIWAGIYRKLRRYAEVEVLWKRSLAVREKALGPNHRDVAAPPSVRLTTKAIAEFKADPRIGRAEAMRRSMLALITSGNDIDAHPTFWAPFVVVGEGGAAR
jgi:hypothetical protein